jgi:phosphohistidine swiveling domain-containing protein
MATQLQPRVIPVDDFAREDLYPGYVPQHGDMPFVEEPVRAFRPEDNARFWFRDTLHFGVGLAPGSIALLDDAQTWGTQLAAEMIGVPPTKGMVNRLAGTHVYLGPIDVASDWQIQARAARFGAAVGPMLANFDSVWAHYEDELRAGYRHFDALDLPSMDRGQLWTALKDAYVFHRRAWYIHFEVMYALAANYLAFYQLAQELGLEGSAIARYLAGRPTTFIRTDEELWKLSRRARELGVADVLQRHEPADVERQLEADPRGRTWWSEFQQFLAEYGWRTEETCTISTPPWIEDPSPALYTLGAFLAKPAEHDFHATQQAVVAEREQLIDEARRKIGGGPNLERFNQALASCQQANFAWWNDEHNFLIDRRIQIPVRRISLALGAHLVDDGQLDAPEDIFFVFKPELYRAMGGAGSGWASLKSFVPERRAYFEEWRTRGPQLPPVLGTVPEEVNDPLMIEIFGLSGQWLETVRHGSQAQELRGFAASRGAVEGIARVINSASELHMVQPGDVLVCDGTTTEWTPVFGIIKACVCDTGGSLSHAAITSREYGIPCVVGAAGATRTIKTGDRVRVDGSLGSVRPIR